MVVEYHTNSYANISNSSQKNDQMKKMVQSSDPLIQTQT